MGKRFIITEIEKVYIKNLYKKHSLNLNESETDAERESEASEFLDVFNQGLAQFRLDSISPQDIESGTIPQSYISKMEELDPNPQEKLQEKENLLKQVVQKICEIEKIEDRQQRKSARKAMISELFNKLGQFLMGEKKMSTNEQTLDEGPTITVFGITAPTFAWAFIALPILIAVLFFSFRAIRRLFWRNKPCYRREYGYNNIRSGKIPKELEITSYINKS